jgi:uncharacterized SAM-binding protein YcdF (DUF218 family)
MRAIARRILTILLLLTAIGGAWFAYYGGRYLQHEDALQKADAIFVLGGMRAERWLEAFDLYKEGYAPIIMLSPERPEPGERLLQARGIRFPATFELQRDALIQLGVPAAAIIAAPGYVDNTAQEAALFRQTALTRGWKRVIIVTSKFHTRRAGFAFRRTFAGTGIPVLVRASRHDPSDPANWWRTRPDFRFVTVEWQKLVFYWLGVGG